LNLVLGNQFMTQLTDKIREAIIGNVGTVISGRIGVTDAELMVKKYQPVFDAEDLTKLPNFQSIASVMINNVPSAPFSMTLLAPMAKDNTQLADAMKRLSAAKYGFSRAAIEKEIFARLEPPKPQGVPSGGPAGGPRTMQRGAPQAATPSKPASFLDEWLSKRQKLATQPATTPSSRPTMPVQSPAPSPMIQSAPAPTPPPAPVSTPPTAALQPVTMPSIVNPVPVAQPAMPQGQAVAVPAISTPVVNVPAPSSQSAPAVAAEGAMPKVADDTPQSGEVRVKLR
jgi:hypothetical protein